MKAIKILTSCALAAGAIFATSGTATAASGPSAQADPCTYEWSSNKATGSATCTGVKEYRVRIFCSDGTERFGVWKTSGKSIATCKPPQAVTHIGAQYVE